MSAYWSQALGEHHDLAQFASGRDVLDRWLREEALRAGRAGACRVTVWTAADDPAAVAFHAIAPTQLARVDLPTRSFSAGYSLIPGYLIGRLALDHALQGQGLGSELLLDALERIVAAASTAGGRLIAVDAIDDAARRFYLRHDFQPIEDADRLIMKVATARTALGR